MNSYIPDSAVNRLTWFKNLKTQVLIDSATLGWDAAKLATFMVPLDSLIAVYQTLVDADTALSKASGNAQEVFTAMVPALRASVAEMKTNPAFNDGMGAAMQIFVPVSSQSPENIKPAIIATAERGCVRITGTKNYAETVNIYMRRNGGAWVLIAPKRKRFPFDDQTPLLNAAIPEIREYMARGVNGDDEIGQDSDIVTATFAG